MPKKDPGWIGVCLPAMDDPFLRKLAASLESAASRADWELRIFSAEGQPETQASRLDAIVSDGAAALVVWPCDEKVMRARRGRTGTVDIPLFTLGVACPGLERKIVAHLAADEQGGAREAVRALVDALGKKGKVAVLNRPGGFSAAERIEAVREQLALYRDITLVRVVNITGTREEARSATQTLLAELPELDAILAVDEVVGLGAKDAVQQAGKTARIKIMAFGDDREIRLAIKQGEIHGTILRDPNRLGEKVVEVVARHLAGKKVPARILVPCRSYLKPDAEIDTTLLE